MNRLAESLHGQYQIGEQVWEEFERKLNASSPGLGTIFKETLRMGYSMGIADALGAVLKTAPPWFDLQESYRAAREHIKDCGLSMAEVEKDFRTTNQERQQA